MDPDVLIQHTLARLAFLILAAGASVRVVLFVFAVIIGVIRRSVPARSVPATLSRSVLPLHAAGRKRPLHVLSRYLFHLSLLIVPLGYSSHLYLLEEHGFAVYWNALPDRWIDRLSLLVICFALYFLARRILQAKGRLSRSYVAVTLITGLPFLTGYALTHGNLDFIPILSRNLENIHALSGELMMVMAVFLFLEVRSKKESCTGCASCASGCPTQALTVQDISMERILNYTPFRCIRCASCVDTCPENAAQLGHTVSAAGFLRTSRNLPIRVLELAACERCGRPVAPKAQLDRLGGVLSKAISPLCPRCRQRGAAETMDNIRNPNMEIRDKIKDTDFHG